MFQEYQEKRYLKGIIISCVQLFSLHVCLWTICMRGAHKSRKRKQNPLKLQLELVVSHQWVLGIKPHLLEEQQVLWAAELSLQPLKVALKNGAISSVFEILYRTNTGQKRQFLLRKRQQLHCLNAFVIIQELSMCWCCAKEISLPLGVIQQRKSPDLNSLLVSLQLMVSGLSIICQQHESESVSA